MRSSDEINRILALRLATIQAPAPFCAFAHQPFPDWGAAPWVPTAAEEQLALRQAAALRTLGIAMLVGLEIPARLREAQPLAACLFIRGQVDLLDASAVALVGSRGACAEAAHWAMCFAARCAHAGHLVVSGGARGIDAAAHQGALDAGGRTLAYLGVAVDRIYPAENRHLFQRILSRGGALVSEHPPMSQSAAWHHAARNRFIAAHAHTLVVAEAAEKSGTLGTARWAHRLKRNVLVPPAGIAQKRAGIDILLQKGMAQVAE